MIVAMKLEDALLLGRKVITNLDPILKSRDITLPTKVHLVKYMVFPVVMYGCESWTVKKFGKTLLVFALLHSVFQGQIYLLLQVFLDFLLLRSSLL